MFSIEWASHQCGSRCHHRYTSTLSTLYSLKNAQAPDNATKIANDQQFLSWLQTQPQTIANLQAISSLTSEMKSLTNATQQHAATLASLNPLYSQGHGALAIGTTRLQAGSMLSPEVRLGRHHSVHAMVNGGDVSR